MNARIEDQDTAADAKLARQEPAVSKRLAELEQAAADAEARASAAAEAYARTRPRDATLRLAADTSADDAGDARQALAAYRREVAHVLGAADRMRQRAELDRLRAGLSFVPIDAIVTRIVGRFVRFRTDVSADVAELSAAIAERNKLVLRANDLEGSVGDRRQHGRSTLEQAASALNSELERFLEGGPHSPERMASLGLSNHGQISTGRAHINFPVSHR